MFSEAYMHRFSGIARLYGEPALKTFSQSHLAIVGLGGVGSWVVESLVRSGVGRLTLMDFDDVCISNTNRQLQALDSNIGKMKTQLLRDRALQINPEICIELIEESYGQDTEDQLFSQKVDLVIDCIDDSYAKFDLALACRRRNLPLIMAGAAGGRRDPAQIKVSDLSKTREDVMLSILRKRLRKKARFPREGKMGITCVFSHEKPFYPQAGGCPAPERPESFLKPLDCSSGFGTSTSITGSFGFFLSSAALEQLLRGARRDLN